jgi:hypothetical protein
VALISSKREEEFSHSLLVVVPTVEYLSGFQIRSGVENGNTNFEFVMHRCGSPTLEVLVREGEISNGWCRPWRDRAPCRAAAVVMVICSGGVRLLGEEVVQHG